MGYRDQSISQTIGAIYDAVLDTALWPQAFAAIGRQVRGDHVIFFTQDTNANRMRFVTGIGVGPDFFARLGTAVAADIMPFGFPTMPAVEARPLGSLCDKSTFDRTDFYNNVVRPDGGFDGLLAVPFRQDGHIGVLAIERLHTAPDYDSDDVDALQAILPHLSNALRIRLKLEDADTAARQTYDAFDLLQFGVIVVDAGMHPVFMNRRAEHITRRNDGLSIGKDGLQAANDDETRALRRAVHAAVESASPRRQNGRDIGKAEPYAARLRLLRPSRESALVATVMPLSPENGERLIVPQARAVIFVIQPSQPLSLNSAAVEAAFGLTPRQAKLAVLIARGASLPQAAATLSTSQETVRSHLKEIFERTGTRRQADLVRVLSVAFAPIAADEQSGRPI